MKFAPHSFLFSVVGLLAAAVVFLFLELQSQRSLDRAQHELVSQRLSDIEAGLEVLGPVIKVMGASSPDLDASTAYLPIQATGEPNVLTVDNDDPLAWCPSAENAGIEWLRLQYPEIVEVSAVLIVANFNPGAVVEILGIDPNREDHVSIWQLGDTPAPIHRFQQISLLEPFTTHCIKLILDTAHIEGWNEIDAVGLITSDGRTIWAESAAASSYWQPDPVAVSEN